MNIAELYRLNPSGPQWPYTDMQLRSDEPHLSLSWELPDSELLALATLDPPVLVWRVRPTTRPADTREETFQQALPSIVDGIPYQNWVAVPTTAAEKAAWDAAHGPQPDWTTFKRTLLGNPAVNALLGGGVATVPAAAISLPTTVINAEFRDAGDFRATWVALRRAQLVSPELMASVRALALACHLPQPFLESIGGAPRPPATSVGQEWVSPDGTPWVVRQARDEDGQFLPDDPSTEARESLEWVEAASLP
jgi:hypothetical protein